MSLWIFDLFSSKAYKLTNSPIMYSKTYCLINRTRLLRIIKSKVLGKSSSDVWTQIAHYTAYPIFYSQTGMDLESRWCMVSKQKGFLFLCARFFWWHATHVLHSSNNYFPKAILFDYKLFALLAVHLSFACRYLACLILEGVACYVERIRQAMCLTIHNSKRR